MQETQGCFIPSDGKSSITIISHSDFVAISHSELHQLSISLPEGVEGEYYMYIQQDRQDPRVNYPNMLASIMAGQQIYADVMVIQKGNNDKTLTQWRVFSNLRFPKLVQMQKVEKDVDKCLIQ